MQPCDKRTKLRKAMIARCRMFLKAYLPFLPGYPLPQPAGSEVYWHFAGADMLLTAETARAAVFGWTELKKYPAAFPQAVDDAEAWHRAVPALLDMLGKAVHGKERLPKSLWNSGLGFSNLDRRRAVNLERRVPGLAPLLDAVSWIFVLAPEPIPFLLDGMERRHEVLGNILDSWPGTEGIDLAVALIQLERQDGPSRTDAIFEILGTKNARYVSTRGASHCEEWDKILHRIAKRTRIYKRIDTPQKPFKAETPQRPKADLAEAVVDFVRKVIPLSTRDRRETLEIFSECVPGDFLRRWKAWWEETEMVLESAENLLTRTRQGIREDNVKRSEQAKKIAVELDDMKKQMPPVFPITFRHREHSSGDVLSILASWSDVPWKSHRKTLQKLFHATEMEQENDLLRLAMLLIFHREFSDYQEEIEKGTINLSILLDEMKSWDIPSKYRARMLAAYWSGYESATRDDLRRLGKAVRFWFVELSQKEDRNDVIRIGRSCDDERKCESLLEEFAKPEYRNIWYGDLVLETAVRFSGTGSEFGKLLKYLNDIENEEAGFVDDDLKRIGELVDFLRETPWGHCGREASLHAEASQILDIAEQFSFLREHQVELALPERNRSSDPEWIGRYPEIFADTLRELDALTPKAKQIAERRLKQLDFDPAQMNAETGRLQRRLSDSVDIRTAERIAKRIENLQKRLEHGKAAELSAARLEHLVGKLRRQVRRLFFEKLRHDIRIPFETIACRELKIEAYPEAWHETLLRRIVLGVIRLDRPAVKRLGIKLLRHILGVNDWNFREEAANEEFLKQIQDQGIDLAPWISPSPPERIAAKNGENLFLGLERNPLEVLKMGAPFRTCLSPWDFNFFSTVSNALDVNKHVLYARDAKGKIKARCLIALSDGGELLAFHPYAHDSELKFKDLVSEFLNRLAEEMKTVVVGHGRVSSLVSPEWYDDGSIPIGGSFDFLSESSEFHETLATISPSELLAELEKQLAPLPLRTYVLPPLLKLPAMERRPELVLPLLPLVSHSLPIGELMKIITFAHQIGARKEANRLIRHFLLHKMLVNFKVWIEEWETTAKEWLAIDPMTLLEHVRHLAPRGTRKLTEYQMGARNRVLIQIYESLGRKNKAKRVV